MQLVSDAVDDASIQLRSTETAQWLWSQSIRAERSHGSTVRIQESIDEHRSLDELQMRPNKFVFHLFVFCFAQN